MEPPAIARAPGRPASVHDPNAAARHLARIRCLPGAHTGSESDGPDANLNAGPDVHAKAAKAALATALRFLGISHSETKVAFFENIRARLVKLPAGRASPVAGSLAAPMTGAPGMEERNGAMSYICVGRVE